MNPLAMACAIFLTGYAGPEPMIDVVDRAPTKAECDLATIQGPYGEWFGAMTDIECYAVTYWTGSGAIVIGRLEQPLRIWVTEAIRAINYQQGRRMGAWEVYNLARRYEECPA